MIRKPSTIRPSLAEASTLAAAALALAPGRAQAMPTADARHLLGRTGFGATAEEIAAMAPLTFEEAVRRLLDGVRREPVQPLPAFLKTRPDWPGLGKKEPAERLAFNRERDAEALELKAWWYREMITTPSPLTERMVLFWHNHFTSSMDKVRQPDLLYRQNALYRREAVGSFRRLLHEVAKDPAMVKYLDNASNRKGAANENFAREVLELFTLGEGHYTEKDIKEAARAFTGWRVDESKGAFLLNARDHDDGPKTIFGKTGPFGGADVVDLVLKQPQTARFITGKLWREFVSGTPDPTEVERLATLFRDSDYSIRALVEALLMSPAFLAPENRAILIKSPVEFMVGTIRMLSIPVADARPLIDFGRRLRQDILNPPNVKGWPGGTEWISTHTLLARNDIVGRFLSGERVTIASAGMMAMVAPGDGMMAIEAPGDGITAMAAPPAGATLAPVSFQFGIDGWLKRHAALGGDAGALAGVMLATAPVSAVAASDPTQTIERILRDPAYHVK